MSSIELEKYSLELKIKKLEIVRDRISLSDKVKDKMLVNCMDEKIKKYKVKLKMLSLDKDLKNDEISLINANETINGKYAIYSSVDYKKMGYIIFSPEEYDTEYGSIGYSIFHPYQGKNYAYKALSLLSKYLKENDVNELSLVISGENTSSIKTAEKFVSNALKTKVQKNKGLNKNLYRYYFKIGEE